MPLPERGAAEAISDETPRLWTEDEFAAFRTSMEAMLREARKMGLSNWELRRIPDAGSASERLAQHILSRRAARGVVFHYGELFGEPAWDMLLDLYVAHERGHPAALSDICLSARVAADVGLHHLAQLERRGLVERLAGIEEDTVRLTATGVLAMARFLEESWPG